MSVAEGKISINTTIGSQNLIGKSKFIIDNRFYFSIKIKPAN